MSEPRLSRDDFALSMLISPRAKREEDNADLRTLLVHRLSDTNKAVARIGLREGRIGVLCEPCHVWIRMKGHDFPQEWRCPDCDRVYEMEFAILEEVNDHGDPGGDGGAGAASPGLPGGDGEDPA